MSAEQALQTKFVPSITDIGKQQWNQLNSNNYPFTRYEFLAALESTGCVGGNSGWQAEHMMIYRDDRLVAALPSYLKSHSYGEYVFDWSWAQAYSQAGREYYPKLISAIPFTPVPGPRLIHSKEESLPSLMVTVFESVQSRVQLQGYSGWHLLFPQTDLIESCSQLPLLRREDIQFHWSNHDYPEFESFLTALRSTKRKQLRRERRIVADQGVVMRRYTSAEISGDVLESFYLCYRQTYLRRSGHSGYLNRAFFESIVNTMADQMMVVLATKDDQAIAASLFFFDSENLYGRYWGCIRDIDCLHFEACYYQGIEFAIEKKLLKFNPGTQGEHKLVRGFEPTKTFSLHWVKDERFQNALEEFMQRESEHKDEYQTAAKQCLPFRRDQSTNEK